MADTPLWDGVITWDDSIPEHVRPDLEPSIRQTLARMTREVVIQDGARETPVSTSFTHVRVSGQYDRGAWRLHFQF